MWHTKILVRRKFGSLIRKRSFNLEIVQNYCTKGFGFFQNRQFSEFTKFPLWYLLYNRSPSKKTCDLMTFPIQQHAASIDYDHHKQYKMDNKTIEGPKTGSAIKWVDFVYVMFIIFSWSQIHLIFDTPIKDMLNSLYIITKMIRIILYYDGTR